VRSIRAALTFIGLIALVIAYLMVTGKNPLPAAGNAVTGLLARAGSLSTPDAAWTERLGDQPTAATVVDHAVVVGTRSGAEVRDAADGRALWSREARWVAVAGDGAGTVVILGKGPDSGYDVADPVSGTVRWRDAAGLAVWAYRDALLSLACPAGKDCALSARSLADGARRWTVSLPAGARLLAGGHVSRADVPALLGLPVDGRIQVVDTANGRRLREEANSAGTRVAVMDRRIIASTAERRGDGCRYSVEARDAVGRVVWRKDGYDLGTASGAGCEQRRDPTGAQGVLVTTRADDRPAVLSTADGRDLWVGAPGESVVATDGSDAVVRAADSIALIDLGGGGVRWRRPLSGDVTLTAHAVVVADAAGGRLVAYDRAGGAALVDVRTEAAVLGAGPNCLVVGRGRTIGPLLFNTSAR
jgi:hypothetical protein